MVNMNKTIILLLSVLLLTLSCSQKESVWTDRAVEIVASKYYVYEPNPLYQDEAEKINKLFKYVLINRNKLSSEEKKKICNQALSQSSKTDTLQSEAEEEPALEDSVDERRALLSRSVLLSTAALVSAPNEALEYTKNARRLLINVADGKPHELLEEEYAMTFILEILILREEDKKVVISSINKLSNLPLDTKKPVIEIIKNL